MPKRKPPKQATFEIEWASRADVRSAIEEMPDEFLECRKRHQWVPYTAEVDPNFYGETERCLNCDTKREQITSRRTGDVISTKYFDRPEGYLFHGIGRIAGEARSEVRRERVERRITQHVKSKKFKKNPDQIEVIFSG